MALLHRTLGVVFLVLMAWTLSASSTPARAAPAQADTIDSCVERLAQQVQSGKVTQDALWEAGKFCQALALATRADNELQIRADNYIFQRGENTVLMWMVVSITIAGVVLAGAQLGASYLLAKVGRGALAKGGSFDLSKDKLAIQSSVVGVIVLAISFAFFLVFVLYVYTFQEPKADSGQQPPHPPRQLYGGALQPQQTIPPAAK